MNTKKIVVLADIESVRVPFTSFEKALKEVSKYELCIRDRYNPNGLYCRKR